MRRANPGRGAWLLFAMAFAAVGAFTFLMVYGIMLYVKLNDLFGLSVILVGLAILLTVWCIIRWAKGEWRLTTLTSAGFFAALVLVRSHTHQRHSARHSRLSLTDRRGVLLVLDVCV